MYEGGLAGIESVGFLPAQGVEIDLLVQLQEILFAACPPFKKLGANLQIAAVGLVVGGNGAGVAGVGLLQPAVATRRDPLVDMPDQLGAFAELRRIENGPVSIAGRPIQCPPLPAFEVSVLARHLEQLAGSLVVPGQQLI